MKKFISPLALISAAAVFFVACTEPTSTTGLNLNASNTIGIVSAGEVQFCLDGTSPGTNTYSVALSNFTGILAGDIQGTTPQALTPGNCITALTKGTSGEVNGLFPSGFVTGTTSTSDVGGTWSFTCTADGTVLAHCPQVSGTGNVATGGASNPHGSQIIFHYEPAVVQISGCTYTQGYYKNHASYTTTTLANGGTFITGGKLDVSGGLDRNLATTTDNTLTAAQVVSTLQNAKNVAASFRQLITAELNVARGATTTAAVDAAITSLRNYYAGTSATKSQLEGWTTTLDQFNNGLILGASPHCGDEVPV